MYLLIKGCLTALLFLLVMRTAAHADEGYVEASVCAGCHAEQTADWQQSDHYHSMLPANEKSVLGDFDEASFTAGKRTSRFFIRDGKYLVETLGSNGKPQTFEVAYTFGYNPLQQYLLRTDGGRLQAFDVAWDSRPLGEGGQRWYQLQDNSVTDPEHPFFWTGYYQNWNSRCASCHSTNLEKHYDPVRNAFNTTYSDVNVACESCHGPGSEHVKLAKTNKISADKTGLKSLGKAIAFHFSGNDPIARPQYSPASPLALATDTCGGCHSRRAELGEPDLTQPFHQQFQLDGVNEPLYFSDGQIRDEVFVLGSFLQSKMAQAGVTCTNCHDPHSGKTKLPGEQICATCHRADVFAAPEHTNGHTDANCLDCHMPARTYMGVDNRRDHRFHRPSALNANSMSPCQSCHEDKSESWLKDAIMHWPKREGASADTLGQWAAFNQAMLTWNADAIADSSRFLADETINLPDLLAVALTEKLVTQSPVEAAELIWRDTQSDSAIRRRGAARAARALPPQQQAKIAKHLMNDEAASVRSEVAAELLNAPVDHILPEATIAPLLDEYAKWLQQSADHPGSNVGLAQLARRRNDIVAAKQFYERALTIDPAFLSARMAFADFLKEMGNARGEKRELKAALATAPDSGAVQFAYGLMLVREKQYDEAAVHLELAYQADDAIPRFAFVYGVSLWQLQRQNEAVKVLANAAARWPADYDLLSTWAKYAYMSKNTAMLKKAAVALGNAYPNDSLYQQLKPLIQP